MPCSVGTWRVGRAVQPLISTILQTQQILTLLSSLKREYNFWRWEFCIVCSMVSNSHLFTTADVKLAQWYAVQNLNASHLLTQQVFVCTTESKLCRLVSQWHTRGRWLGLAYTLQSSLIRMGFASLLETVDFRKWITSLDSTKPLQCSGIPSEGLYRPVSIDWRTVHQSMRCSGEESRSRVDGQNLQLSNRDHRLAWPRRLWKWPRNFPYWGT